MEKDGGVHAADRSDRDALHDREVVRQHALGEARLLLVEVDGDEIELDRRLASQCVQGISRKSGDDGGMSGWR